MTQVLEKPQATSEAPEKDPLTRRDRTIIATIVNNSDYPYKCEVGDVITIWINDDDVVWVKMTHGYARYDKNQFKAAVAEVKATLPETPKERNDPLSEELQTACKKFKLWHGQVDWLSFSTKLFRDNELVGFVGCNEQGWYCRRRQYGPSQQALSKEFNVVSWDCLRYSSQSFVFARYSSSFY